jgi:hypothetical protein
MGHARLLARRVGRWQVTAARMLSVVALELPCPQCGTQMYAEQAHNRCPACLYIEPCCDGAPQPCRVPVVAATEGTQ